MFQSDYVFFFLLFLFMFSKQSLPGKQGGRKKKKKIKTERSLHQSTASYFIPPTDPLFLPPNEVWFLSAAACRGCFQLPALTEGKKKKKKERKRQIKEGGVWRGRFNFEEHLRGFLWVKKKHKGISLAQKEPKNEIIQIFCKRTKCSLWMKTNIFCLFFLISFIVWNCTVKKWQTAAFIRSLRFWNKLQFCRDNLLSFFRQNWIFEFLEAWFFIISVLQT